MALCNVFSFDQHIQFLYHHFSSKEEFDSKYRKFYDGHNDTRIKKFLKRELFWCLLKGLNMAVRDGDSDIFTRLNTFVSYLSEVECLDQLIDYYSKFQNPIRNSNFVIEACKLNKPHILKLIFDDDSILQNLSIFSGRNYILPDDKDENCHNAFYYALCSSNNIEMIDMLIQKWPMNDFSCDLKSGDILLKAYEELKLKNILLSNELRFYIESKLLDLYCYANEYKGGPESVCVYSSIERVNLMLESTKLLTTEYMNKFVDGKFLFIAKFVAQNIYILKRQLKSTYDRLPWEEIEFCLVTFISSQAQTQEINLFNCAVLKKDKILSFLEIFATELDCVAKDENILKQTDRSKLNHEKNVAMIINKNPEFQDMYDIYQKLRDINSLQKINNYIQLSLLVNPEDREGQIIIIRVIHVIREYFLKDTLVSPKLSKNIKELLFVYLPRSAKEIITELDYSLSYTHSMERPIAIEESLNVDFYRDIQGNTKEIENIISRLLNDFKVKIIRALLTQVMVSESLHEMKEASTILKNLKLDQISFAFKMAELERLQALFNKLESIIPNDKIEIFRIIECKICRLKKENALAKNNYNLGITSLTAFGHIINDDKIGDYYLQNVKLKASALLSDLSLKSNADSLREIADLLKYILPYIILKVEEKDSDIVHRYTLEYIYQYILEIFYIIENETGSIKWFQELRKKIRRKCILTPVNTKSMTEEKCKILLKLKVDELKSILKNNTISNDLFINCCYFKFNKKFEVKVEMLVLDILSILEGSNNNTLLLDNIPILIGKHLQNNLAEFHELIDILFFDPSIAVFFNAYKLASEIINENNGNVRKIKCDNPIRSEFKFKHELEIIDNQEKAFIYLEEGNFEGFKSCLKKGADINARTHHLWTSIHFAAKGPNLELFKFINDKCVINKRDVNGQNVLHIAALYGREDIVEFLITKAMFSIDDADFYGRTPLHLASQNGHKQTTLVLLKYKANILEADSVGLSPIYYAIRNNHINIVKILLRSTNVDVYETTSGLWMATYGWLSKYTGSFMQWLTPLHEAAECGHLEITNLLLSRGSKVNAKNDSNWTPLHSAAQNGFTEIAKALILNGAQINAKEMNGLSSLHCAAEAGHEEVIDILLTNGASIDILNKMKQTPLHYATLHGHKNVVNILLNYKANANAADAEGMTILHFAAQMGHFEIVLTLLTFNVDVNVKTKKGSTPLHWAAKCGHRNVVEILLQNKTVVNVQDQNGFTPLHEAIFNGNKEIINLLLGNIATFNMKLKNDIGIMPLHAAVIRNNNELIEFLLKHKGDVNTKSADGVEPLHLAAKYGFRKTVAYLIKNMANVNSKDDAKMTPLLYASLFGHIGIVNDLIKNKAKLDDKNDFTQWTALHTAVANGHNNIVNILIQNNAQRSIRDKNNMTPLELAVFLGFLDIVKIFIKNKVDVNECNLQMDTLLHKAADRGHKDVVKELIKNGANIHALNCFKETPLFIASKSGFVDIVDILKTAGASITCTDAAGFTPLHKAAANGHLDVVKLLLVNNEKYIKLKCSSNKRSPLELAVFYGQIEVVKAFLEYKIVNINSKGTDGFTILHIAAQQNNLEVAKYLLEKGSNINAKNNKGSKPIDIAAREGHLNIVTFFLNKGCSIEDPGAGDETLLYQAAGHGHTDVVKYLIEKGADINAKNSIGLTSIHGAAFGGYKDTIEELFKNGVVSDTVADSNLTPLKMARNETVHNLIESTGKLFECVKHNRFSEFKICIKNGAFIHVKNYKGETLLHYAVWKGNNKIVCFLLNHNVEVNATDNKGCTPLHYASKYSHLEIVKLLLTNGARYNDLSESGKTPLDVTKDESIRKLLDFIDTSFRDVESNNSKVVDKLKEIKDVDTLKAVMNAYNADNRSLIRAAIYNDFEKIEELEKILLRNVIHEVNIAIKMLDENNYNEALHIFQNILVQKRKEIFSHEKLDIFYIQSRIGKILHMLGSYAESLNIFENIYKKQNEILGFKDRSTLSTRSFIATLLYTQEKYKEAIYIFQEVYLWQKRLNGPDHIDTLETQLYMALVLSKLEKYEEALKMNQEVYFRRKETNDLTALHAQSNIAMVLSYQQKYEEAINIYKEVLEKKEQKYGMNNNETLTTKHNIAQVLFNMKNYNEALKSHEHVLRIRREVLGPNNPDTLTTQCEIGTILFRQNKWNCALAVFEEVLERTRKILCPLHPSVIRTEKMIGKVKVALKVAESVNYDHAEYLQKQMYKAASAGNINIINDLLKFDIDINSQDVDGRTLLHYAISNEKTGVVNVLLKNGADLNLVTIKGNTPLHTATSKGDNGTVNLLLEHFSCNDLKHVINAQTFAGGTTALHVAAKNGFRKTVLSLLNHGATYNLKNKEGKTPLDLSEDQSIIDILTLVKESFEDAKKADERLINNLKDLKDQDFAAVIKARNEMQNTILQVLVSSETKVDVNLVQNLFKLGVDINDKDDNGRSLIHYAINSGQTSIVEVLLKNGADVNIFTKEGNTPLHAAACKGNKQIMEMLLDHVNFNNSKDFINAQTFVEKDTALHVAAKNGFIDIMLCLLNHGAVNHLKNKEGKMSSDLLKDRKF